MADEIVKSGKTIKPTGERPATGKFVVLLDKFLDKLPFHKLTANQTFDLAADFLMAILVIIAMFFDLGPNGYRAKVALIFSVFFFTAWSLHINQK